MCVLCQVQWDASYNYDLNPPYNVLQDSYQWHQFARKENEPWGASSWPLHTAGNRGQGQSLDPISSTPNPVLMTPVVHVQVSWSLQKMFILPSCWPFFHRPLTVKWSKAKKFTDSSLWTWVWCESYHSLCCDMHPPKHQICQISTGTGKGLKIYEIF